LKTRSGYPEDVRPDRAQGRRRPLRKERSRPDHG
jgi:hypothetical protein